LFSSPTYHLRHKTDRNVQEIVQEFKLYHLPVSFSFLGTNLILLRVLSYRYEFHLKCLKIVFFRLGRHLRIILYRQHCLFITSTFSVTYLKSLQHHSVHRHPLSRCENQRNNFHTLINCKQPYLYHKSSLSFFPNIFIQIRNVLFDGLCTR